MSVCARGSTSRLWAVVGVRLAVNLPWVMRRARRLLWTYGVDFFLFVKSVFPPSSMVGHSVAASRLYLSSADKCVAFFSFPAESGLVCASDDAPRVTPPLLPAAGLCRVCFFLQNPMNTASDVGADGNFSNVPDAPHSSCAGAQAEASARAPCATPMLAEQGTPHSSVWYTV